jgi:thiamine-phosphate pyrophosphorylase
VSKKLVEGLYCITPEYDNKVQYGRMVRSACAGGADVIQFRNKELGIHDRVKICRKLRGITSGYGVKFIVNDDMALALYVKADGVHLGQGDLPVKAARRLLEILGRKNFIVGASACDLKGALRSAKEGADYLGVGPVFPTPIKPGLKPVKTGLLRRVKKAAGIPIIAIGGINRGNIGEVMQSGVEGAAVIRAVADSRDVKRAARELKSIIEDYKRRN